VRRLAPRPLSAALAEAVGDSRPAGLLAAVQSLWPDVAGEVVAAASAPASERDRTVTVECESAVWAHELELLAPDLIGGLNERLEGAAEPARVERLRFVVGSDAKRS
jgi:predicted nucleic acid-binding Zn ribbon protein